MICKTQLSLVARDNRLSRQNVLFATLLNYVIHTCGCYTISIIWAAQLAPKVRTEQNILLNGNKVKTELCLCQFFWPQNNKHRTKVKPANNDSEMFNAKIKGIQKLTDNNKKIFLNIYLKLACS